MQDGSNAQRVQLYVDSSEISNRALRILTDNKKSFQLFRKGKEFRDCDFDLPTLFAIFGTFHGLEEIQMFARSNLG